jgi:hypothetical protein
MSSKVANLIALELGVLIAILAWLAFSNLESNKPQSMTRQTMRTVDSFATVAPGLRSTNSRQPVVNYRADLPANEPATEAETAVQTYQQPAASEPYPNSGVDDGYIAETPPYYDTFQPEPVLDSPYCFSDPLYYPQTSAIVVYSNSRFPNRRFRSAQRPGGARMVAHRPPAMVARHSPQRVAPPHLRDGGVRPRQNAPVQSSRPRPRLGPRHNP